MAIYSVDSAQVADAAALTHAQVEKIRTDVSAMMAQLRSLQSTWTGAASVGFAACADQWQATQIQVEQALEAISAQLNHAAATYEQAESQAAALFVH